MGEVKPDGMKTVVLGTVNLYWQSEATAGTALIVDQILYTFLCAGSFTTRSCYSPDYFTLTPDVALAAGRTQKPFLSHVSGVHVCIHHVLMCYTHTVVTPVNFKRVLAGRNERSPKPKGF